MDRPNLHLNGRPLERKNVSTQERTDGMNNRKALKKAMTAEYQDQEGVRDRASC